jgi:hypothetical protein
MSLIRKLYHLTVLGKREQEGHAAERFIREFRKLWVWERLLNKLILTKAKFH